MDKDGAEIVQNGVNFGQVKGALLLGRFYVRRPLMSKDRKNII